MIDKDGNVVINATLDNNTYGAVLRPRLIGGVPYIKSSSIITNGLDTPHDLKEKIISVITTQRGKYNEIPLIVEDDEKG